MLGITMQLDMSDRLTPQVITTICHHMKKILLKKERKKNIYRGTRPEPIC